MSFCNIVESKLKYKIAYFLSTEDNCRIDDDESLNTFITNTDDSNEVRLIAMKEQNIYSIKVSTLKTNGSVLIEASNFRQLKEISKQILKTKDKYKNNIFGLNLSSRIICI